eukprot:CAMPEP_0176094346 /NCGR_PEP_ID=MMETSP0120_2-20121206/47278_1 /TAXON_ID=160619 /ORGANISM="Kryptoperidinium foliaceum, Strain CCMP 1326" /LENGTH=119 /DNA_ID=CAMNT_0017428289 /DNA_START=41 /DNA_END=400 /DNA_ORIENTATION=+
MKTVSLLVASAFLVSSSTGFLLLPNPGNGPAFLALKAEESSFGDDFDAPSDRAASVGNMVETPPSQKLFGVLEVPKFLSDAFQGKKKAEDPHFIVDDECYLGKNGNMDECADFDPPHSP